MPCTFDVVTDEWVGVYPENYVVCEACRAVVMLKAQTGGGAHWDWWVVGGRFNGLLIGKPEPVYVGMTGSDDPQVQARLREYSNLEARFGANTGSIEQALETMRLDAFVTPDCRWFGPDHPEFEAEVRSKGEGPTWSWRTKRECVLRHYGSGHLVVGVDAHS